MLRASSSTTWIISQYARRIGFEKAESFVRAALRLWRAQSSRYSAEARAGNRRELLVIGRDFGYDTQPRQWKYWGQRRTARTAAPGSPRRISAGKRSSQPGSAGYAARQAAGHRRRHTHVSSDREQSGRFQVLPGRPEVILDVAHNPAAARALADTLQRMPRPRRTSAVFAMLADKDIEGVIDAVKKHIDEWHVAGSRLRARRCGNARKRTRPKSGVRERLSARNDRRRLRPSV